MRRFVVAVLAALALPAAAIAQLEPVLDQVCPLLGCSVPSCGGDLASCEAALAASSKFPATGQTTSYAAGDDGELEKGATLSYTDNGDGTITDNNTGLVWEKKSEDLSIHDVGFTFAWENALLSFISQLNNRCANDETVDCRTNGDFNCAGPPVFGGPCGFAGHRDWRLPNIKELQSIVNYGTFSPAVSSAFDNGCAPGCTVTTCSCSSLGFTWSSTSYQNPTDAWFVYFYVGNVDHEPKYNNRFVRAVRGGS